MNECILSTILFGDVAFDTHTHTHTHTHTNTRFHFYYICRHGFYGFQVSVAVLLDNFVDASMEMEETENNCLYRTKIKSGPVRKKIAFCDQHCLETPHFGGFFFFFDATQVLTR